MRDMGLFDIFLFAALGLMWGSAFLFIKLALDAFAPFDIVFWRLTIASIVLGAVYMMSAQPLPRSLRPWLVVAALGLVGNALPFSLVSWAQLEVPSSLAAILISASPIATAFLVPLCVKEEVITRRRALGIGIGFVGVIVLMGGLTLAALTYNLLPKLALLGAATGYAAGGIIIRLARDIRPEFIAFGMNLMGMLMIAPVAFLTGDPLGRMPDWQSGGAVLALGLFPSALASVFLILLTNRVGAATAATTNYLVPLVGATLGILVFGEPLGPNIFAGLTLILFGIWLSARRRIRAAEMTLH